MKPTSVCTLAIALLLSGCAGVTTVPVAVSCPPPPSLPAVLTSPASTGPSLNERMEKLLADFERELEALLMKVQRQP